MVVLAFEYFKPSSMELQFFSLEKVIENRYAHVNGDDIVDDKGQNACWLWNHNDCIDNGVNDSSDGADFKQQTS